MLDNATADHFIYIVDDDARVREALIDLLRSAHLNAVAFSCASDYIAHARPDVPGCLVLDVELPDINGLELQRRLAPGGHPPIVFLTGHGDVPLSVQAVKAGAVDFLTKPFSKSALLASINEALALDRSSQAGRAELARLKGRLALLTPRERDVLPLVVGGLLNKQAAAELGISEVTLQIHRSRIMQKMQAASIADLVRMASTLQIQPAVRRTRGAPVIGRASREGTIAVVDDDPRVLESLSGLLTSAGHSVRLFASAEAALEPHALDRVDCLISDIGLPGMDGQELKRSVRGAKGSLPVILITGSAKTIPAGAAEAAAYQELFYKPFAGLQLLAAVETALGLRGRASR